METDHSDLQRKLADLEAGRAAVREREHEMESVEQELASVREMLREKEVDNDHSHSIFASNAWLTLCV